jgi:hypothetical protein
VGVQEVRWDKGGTVTAGIILLSMEKGMKIIYSERSRKLKWARHVARMGDKTCMQGFNVET